MKQIGKWGLMRRQQFILLAALALLGGCKDGSGEGHNRSHNPNIPARLGNYLTADQTAGADQMGDSAFSQTRIPCTDERTIANALFAIVRSQMNPAGVPQMVDYGVDDVALKDGPGRIAVIVITFRPGDPGVISTIANYYLLNTDCRVQMWRTVGS
jgi:hypothetical protein